MRHVAAYLLASMGGNENPTAKDIKAILSSVGVEADDKALSIVIDSLKGKKVFELMAEGQKLLADVPAGGSSSAGPVAGPAQPAAAESKAPAVEKPKTPPPQSDSDDDMGLGLFDD